MSRHTPHLALRLARSAEEVAAAQALRHRVFVEELGACGGALSDPAAGLEADRFDPFCEHILLLDTLRGGAAIATTRVMTEESAERAGGFATEEEFDISALRCTGRHLLEVGRTCLLPDYRGGAAMHRLWQGIGSFAEKRGTGILFGLASFQGRDPGAVAQPLTYLHHEHLAPEDRRPRSRMPLATDHFLRQAVDRRAAVLAMPPHIKAYLRLGGQVGEGAYLDAAFGCIDVCMVIDTAALPARSRAIYSAPAP
jgi:putative hemolysin